MYDDFKLCGEGDFLKIAKEYSTQQKVQISSLNSDNQNLKQEFNNVLNMAKNAYFALKQSDLKDFSSILKVVQSNNIRLSDEYKRIFNEIFVPSVDTEVLKINKNSDIKEILMLFIGFIDNFFKLVFNNNMDNLKENVSNYLDIIKEILI